MTYRFRPGSIAERAIAHIYAAKDPRGESHSVDLATALDVSINVISPCLKRAVKAGLLNKRAHQGKVLYSRGTVQSAHKQPLTEDPAGRDTGDDDDAAADHFVHRRVKATDALPRVSTTAARSVFDLVPPSGRGGADPGSKQQAAGPWKQPAAAAKAKGKSPGNPTSKTPAPQAATAFNSISPIPIPIPPERAMACALYNTGDLVIEVPDQHPIRLTRTQTRDLVSYLRHVEHSINQEITTP